MSAKHPIRGRTPWLAQGGAEDPHEELCARQRVTYRCERGHTFEVTFAASALAPAAWECRCGKPAELDHPPPAELEQLLADSREDQTSAL